MQKNIFKITNYIKNIKQNQIIIPSNLIKINNRPSTLKKPHLVIGRDTYLA